MTETTDINDRKPIAWLCSIPSVGIEPFISFTEPCLLFFTEIISIPIYADDNFVEPK